MESRWTPPRRDRIRVPDPDLTDEERKRQPHRIAGAGYRFDNLGWLHDRRKNVYLVDPNGGEPVALTTGDYRDAGLAWRPDGSAVGFISARHDRLYVDPGSQPWEVPVAGGDPVALAPVGSWNELTYRPDGVAHVTGDPDPWGYPRVSGCGGWIRRSRIDWPPLSTATSACPHRRLPLRDRNGSKMVRSAPQSRTAPRCASSWCIPTVPGTTWSGAAADYRHDHPA